MGKRKRARHVKRIGLRDVRALETDQLVWETTQRSNVGIGIERVITARRMPRRARRKDAAFNNHHIRPAEFRQVTGN